MSSTGGLRTKKKRAAFSLPPPEAYVEAKRRIERVRSVGSYRLELSGLKQLEALPPEIEALEGLSVLEMRGTKVENFASLSALIRLDTLDLRESRISNLEFLQSHSLLRVLDLSSTPISDIGLVRNLNKLAYLGLARTKIDDVAALQGLISLRTLDLMGTRISDISPLANLIGLQSLNLNYTRIEELSALFRLQNLERLSLDNTRVADLAPLGKLINLKALSAMNSRVRDLWFVANLKGIETLDLSGTLIQDLSPLTNLVALRRLDLDYTRVTDLSPLSKLSRLESVHFDRSEVSDITPLMRLTSLQDASVRRAPYAWFVGLSYHSTPLSHRPPFYALAELSQPERTVETINYLRRKHGLDDHVPEGYARPEHIEEIIAAEARPADDIDLRMDPEVARALEQRPATYSFPYENGQFHGRPQISDPAEFGVATAIYGDVKRKAVEAAERLGRCNAPKRLLETIDRLIGSLGTNVGDVVPGELLMRSRSLDSDLASYDTEAARREIPEDALAQFMDLVTSVADLKACYPAIIKLEAARVAQELVTKDVTSAIAYMSGIRDAAAGSEVVAASAVEALEAGDPEIELAKEIMADRLVSDAARATAAMKRAEMAAQMLLDHRNFVASVLKTGSGLLEKIKGPAVSTSRAALKVASETGNKFAKKVPGPLSDAMVATAIGALAGSILGPAAGLAGFLASYKPLAQKGAQVVKAAKELRTATRSRLSKGKHRAVPKDNGDDDAA